MPSKTNRNTDDLSRLLLTVLALLIGPPAMSLAQTGGFTYQARLSDGGTPANGNYDLTFQLYDSSTGGNQVGVTITNANQSISNGLLTATLSFGANRFVGGDRWLQIGVRTNGAAAFVALGSRQPLTPSPYAIFANAASSLSGTLPAGQLSGTLASAQLSGTYSGAVTFSSVANQFSGSFTGNGAGVTGVAGTNLDNATYLTMMKGLESGDTFANWGRFSWANTYQAIRSGKSFQVLRVGDGLADRGMLYNASLLNLTNYFPLAGFTGVKKGLFDADVSGAASRQTAQSGLWLPQWWLITDSGGTVTSAYGGYLSPDGLPANVAAVYYVAEPDAGHFAVQTNINNGAWTTVSGLANVDASSGSAVGKIAASTNSASGLTKIRVIGNDPGKSVKILGFALFDTTITGGLIANDWVPISGPGSATLQQILTTNLAVTAPIFAWWNPQLVLFEKIGFGDSTNFVAMLDFLKTNTPNADVVLCGLYPVFDDGLTPGDRLYMRTNAMAYGFGYFDGWTPFMDTHQMLSRGWIAGDLVHGLVSGYGAYDSLLTYWLALDAPVNSPGLTNLNITVSFLPTNALSSWPMAARTPGGAAQVNSNGTIYMLVSGPGSTAWTKTNYISGP